MKEMKKNYLKPEIASSYIDAGKLMFGLKSGGGGAKDGDFDFSSSSDEAPAAATWSEDDED